MLASVMNILGLKLLFTGRLLEVTQSRFNNRDGERCELKQLS